ncbi:MAG: Tn3 family transposase, partial [Acidimicrobiales bacterium]
MIAALPLAGGPAARSLLHAVDMLRDLNATGRRLVPDDAPEDFVPSRWQGYLDAARQAGRTADHRHYWELAVVYSLQVALRSGDIWVPGSRRYADPATHFIPPSDWPPLRDEFCALTATPLDSGRRLDDLRGQLWAALAALDPILANDAGAARIDPDGQLVVTPLSAEQAPAEAVAAGDEVGDRLPHVDLPSLLIEVDAWNGFTDHLVHAGGATHRGPDLRRNLYAAVMAQATNLGFAGMADSSGIGEDTLAWTTRWYLREETLREANTALVNYHHRQPLAQVWGGGTLSSSDGQRFPQRGKSLTARALSRYFVDEGTTAYTHVADQHSTYGTKVIPST